MADGDGGLGTCKSWIQLMVATCRCDRLANSAAAAAAAAAAAVHA